MPPLTISIPEKIWPIIAQNIRLFNDPLLQIYSATTVFEVILINSRLDSG
jgi:hypothetical protein